MSLAVVAVLASVLQVNVVTDAGVARGSCVLVQRTSTEHGVTLYFLTAASLFRGADGERFTIEMVTVEQRDRSPLPIAVPDVIMPAATILDIAVLKGTVASSDLVPR